LRIQKRAERRLSCRPLVEDRYETASVGSVISVASKERYLCRAISRDMRNRAVTGMN